MPLSPCNISRFLLAVLGEEEGSKVMVKFSLPRPSGSKQGKICPSCGRTFFSKHGAKQWRNQIYCSRECFCKSRQVWLICDQCGEGFWRRASLLLQYPGYRSDNPFRHGKPRQYIFCSRHCHGVWFGTHHGFGVHPESLRPTRKWDREKVWARHLETSWGARRLSLDMGIPRGTISLILAKARKASGKIYKKPTRIDPLEVLRLKAEGLSQPEIGKAIGCHRSSVWRILKRL